jgi:hypothetical protein
VVLLAKRHPGARGLRRLRVALPCVDGGAASPKETWLRLLLIDAGLPPPTTQIPVLDGYRTVAFLDMGREEFKVAAEYDGDQHRSDRRQYVKDIRRHELVDDLGWHVVRVVSEDRSSDVIDRIYNALWRRGTAEIVTSVEKHDKSCANVDLGATRARRRFPTPCAVGR